MPRAAATFRHPIRALLALAVLACLVANPVSAAPLEQVMATVFTVHSADAEDRFLGSAFLWGEGAFAVTNAHVIGNATEVRLTDARGVQEIATVMARDPSRDVAVISVKPGRGGLLPSPDAPRLGAEVWAFGAPLGVEFSVTEGRISALQRQVEPAVPILMLQHDAAVNPGSSGGPLVDDAGALVGMNAQIADGSRMFVGIAYAIPARDLARIVGALVDGTLAPLPKLGLTARVVNRQLAEALDIPATGLLVDRVAPGDLAEAAGIVAGDVILALNDRPLTQPGDLAFAVEAAQRKGHVDFTLLRDGVVLVLMADLSLAKPMPAATPTPVSASHSLTSLGMTLGAGNRITAVAEGSAAEGLGIVPGDRILKMNGIAPAQDMRFTKPILLLLAGLNGDTRHVLIDPWATAPRIRPKGGANVLDPDVMLF